MKVLLLGARGMLGRDLAATAPASVALRAVSRAEVDVTEPRAVAAALDAHRPDVVMNASGYTAVDGAESDRAGAFAVNATAVTTLAEACASRGVMVVHFSTDYVFDGAASRPYRENDPPAPINVYGESKLAGERGLSSSGAPVLLVRAQWLFGSAGTSFVHAMSARARRRQPTRVVDDQRGRPTSARDLASATWRLIGQGTLGVFHLANAGDATWYELAAKIFAHRGAPELVTPCSSEEYRSAARRPSYSVLDTGRVEQVLGEPLPHWQEALGRFLSSLPEHQETIRR